MEAKEEKCDEEEQRRSFVEDRRRAFKKKHSNIAFVSTASM